MLTCSYLKSSDDNENCVICYGRGSREGIDKRFTETNGLVHSPHP